MARLRKTCPRCKGRNVAKIVYGLVKITEDLERELEEGRTVLGGCCVQGGGADPAQECRDCGLEWGSTAMD